MEGKRRKRCVQKGMCKYSVYMCVLLWVCVVLSHQESHGLANSTDSPIKISITGNYILGYTKASSKWEFKSVCHLFSLQHAGKKGENKKKNYEDIFYVTVPFP